MNELRPHASDPGLGTRVRRSLAALSRAACAEPLVWMPRACFSWEHVVLRPARRGRLATLPDLRRELRAIHLWEQIELLRGAVELRLAGTLAGRLLGEPWALDEGCWRERCADEIGAALASGMRVIGELLACALQPRSSWSSALELAQALVALRTGPGAKLLLARTQFAAGEREAAHATLERMDVARLTLLERASWRLCRAELVLADGGACDGSRRTSEATDPALAKALDHLQRAAVLGAGLRARLSALALAQELDATAQEALALERIAELGSDAARRGRALRELVEARALLGRPLGDAARRRLERSLGTIVGGPSQRCEA